MYVCYISGKHQVHTFEDIDMQPPIPASEVDKPTALIIAEMLRLRGDLERILAAPPRGGNYVHVYLCCGCRQAAAAAAILGLIFSRYYCFSGV